MTHAGVAVVGDQATSAGTAFTRCSTCVSTVAGYVCYGLGLIWNVIATILFILNCPVDRFQMWVSGMAHWFGQCAESVKGAVLNIFQTSSSSSSSSLTGDGIEVGPVASTGPSSRGFVLGSRPSALPIGGRAHSGYHSIPLQDTLQPKNSATLSSEKPLDV